MAGMLAASSEFVGCDCLVGSTGHLSRGQWHLDEVGVTMGCDCGTDSGW